jgi:hypothetical protein
MLTWREQQLSWSTESVSIHQDQALVNYIQSNCIQSAIIHGDQFFSQYLIKVEHGPVDFVIWIENKPFDFDQLIADINLEIDTHLAKNGVLYLSINKFLCVPKQYNNTLSENYEDAILEYVRDNVNAKIEKYLPNRNSTGDQFNWTHPLTRFYLRK